MAGLIRDTGPLFKKLICDGFTAAGKKYRYIIPHGPQANPVPNWRPKYRPDIHIASVAKLEMDVLDINLTKDSSLFAPSYSQSLLLAELKENHTLLWFLKSLQKNPRN